MTPKRWWRSWRRLVGPARAERELYDELRFHIDREAAKLTAAGHTPEEARALASRRFGSLPLTADRCRDASRLRVAGELLADAKFAVRHMARRPLVTAAMVVVLSLGLGVSTAVFVLFSSISSAPPAGVAARRDAVLHHIDSKEKERPEEPRPAPAPVIDKTIRARPAVVHGYTRNMRSPEGKVNITLNSDDEGLLEVFVNVGRAGSDIAALAEALGRLTGLLLRLPSPLTPEERAREVVNQLRGIGGSRTVGFGLEQVRSLPDAIGLALQKHLEGQIGSTPPARTTVMAKQQPLPGLQLTGNLCPECGSTAFVYEEGCKKCHACGHSEC